MEKKVGFVHSMMFRIVCLFVGGILLTSLVFMGVAISQNQKSTKSLVQSYMLSSAESTGYILDTVLQTQGKKTLENADDLSQILSEVSIEGMESSYAYLVSSDGTMLYHPTADKIGQSVENEVVKKLVEDLKGGTIAKPACVEYEFKGAMKYASYYINPEGNYILVVTADESDAFQIINQMRNLMIGILFGILIVLTALGCFMVNQMVKPLHRLTKVVDKVAGLDFTSDSEVQSLAKRQDEIGLIGTSICNLHGELREIISAIQTQGIKLSESNSQFAKEFSQIVGTVDSVNIAVEEIATGSTSQAQEASTANEHITDIGNTIESNNTSVEALEQSIEKMTSLAKESANILEDLVRVNAWSTETIGAVSEQTDRTNKSVARINEAVVAIQDIAEQTNLLSLNASIEAARAGESGRGFAVVAEQIRKLAVDSAESAEQIEAIVQELIANSEDGVAKMHELSDGSKVQAERLETTKGSFTSLQQEIQSVSMASKEILEQTSSMNRLKNSMSDMIQQLAAIAQQNAASTQETSASMYTLTQNLDKCKDETEVLSGLSSQLNEQTQKFKF